MFIIDFDDTLFDSELFKQARIEALARLGVASDVYQTTYQEAYKSTDGLFAYSNERHADSLAQRGFEREVVLRALESTHKRLAEFLDSEAIVFLETLKKFHQPMVLLSIGDPTFQELKIKGSGIENFFDRLFMVDYPKEKVIHELVVAGAPENFWFINDKVIETETIVRQFPKARAILKISPKISIEEYHSSLLPSFTSLLSIAEYVTANT